MSQTSAAFTPADRDAAILTSRPLVETAFLPPPLMAPPLATSCTARCGLC
ncbi:hypothetical protein H9L05_09470 [Hymenobacter qilianensis]|uniref:Uncharacterized protein n=1 Tax=Hymenobacter qilianensis TaxID=1385715 RepID=A0A7H0GZM5_9BACT|nr:hypothetical protein [Hymenobacter qilianensis]QNP53741.1 hypothetical protein H9L05_09470 [Hymenobacter qilianensis]